MLVARGRLQVSKRKTSGEFLADGDKSSSGGLGTDVDSMSFLHSECWSHLYTNHFGAKRNKPQKIEFRTPDAMFPGLSSDDRRKGSAIVSNQK